MEEFKLGDVVYLKSEPNSNHQRYVVSKILETSPTKFIGVTWFKYEDRTFGYAELPTEIFEKSK